MVINYEVVWYLNSARIITYILFKNREVKAFINGTLEFCEGIH